MEPKITFDELISKVEEYENNQLEKIQKIKKDTQELKTFLTIDSNDFPSDTLYRIGLMMQYIDHQSGLYQKAKAKYDLAATLSNFSTQLNKLLVNGDIGADIASQLVNNENFQDVVASAIVGQFADKHGTTLDTKFNKKDFDSLIQRGASAEVSQIVRRVFWAQNKKKDQIDITVKPVGSKGGAQDIILAIEGKGPKGGSHKLTLREDVKSSLQAHYLMSETLGSFKEDIKELLKKSMRSATRINEKLYLTVNNEELWQLVAERLGKKYGVAYYNGVFRADRAIFFTSPDGSIEMGSEMLKRRDFQIEMNDEITKMAVRLGYISAVVSDQDK
jgi:hypothetical protein